MPAGRRDRLTIARLLVLTAGVAVGLTWFSPNAGDVNDGEAGTIRDWMTAFLIGLSLPGIIYPVARGWRDKRFGLGAALWLTLAIGALLMLPPIIANRYDGNSSNGQMALACIYYVMPLTSFWFCLAILISSNGVRIYRRSTAWTERFGFYLGLCWTPLGAWHLFNFYWSAFESYFP